MKTLDKKTQSFAQFISVQLFEATKRIRLQGKRKEIGIAVIDTMLLDAFEMLGQKIKDKQNKI